MGAVLAFLSSANYEDVHLDFENAQPTDKELETYNLVSEFLQRSEEIMALVSNYQNCQDAIRAAIRDPSEANEAAAFVACLGNVAQINEMYKFSNELKEIAPRLLLDLCRDSGDGGAERTLEDQQALCRQLAQIFGFALAFDHQRMLHPALSNDFSYYRRLLPKHRGHPDIVVNDEEASTIVMWTAGVTPMMNLVARSVQTAAAENEVVTMALAIMANSCVRVIGSEAKGADAADGGQDMLLLYARAMTGAIIAFDHVDAMGAFHKKSPIDIKRCIKKVLEVVPEAHRPLLINSLKFTTRTYNQDTTPSSVRELLE